jgi:hypothetical protein
VIECHANSINGKKDLELQQIDGPDVDGSFPGNILQSALERRNTDYTFPLGEK